MEAADREAIRRFWLRGLAQKVDCRKDVRLDQSQSPPGSRLRALRYDCRRLRPPRHDPHHAQAACCKRLFMNPNFPDGLLTPKYLPIMMDRTGSSCLTSLCVNRTPRITSVTGCRSGRPAFSSPSRAPRLRTRSALGQSLQIVARRKTLYVCNAPIATKF